jgi:hypothetical protein
MQLRQFPAISVVLVPCIRLSCLRKGELDCSPDPLAADRRLAIGRDLVSLVSFGFPQQEKQDKPNNQQLA